MDIYIYISGILNSLGHFVHPFPPFLVIQRQNDHLTTPGKAGVYGFLTGDLFRSVQRGMSRKLRKCTKGCKSIGTPKAAKRYLHNFMIYKLYSMHSICYIVYYVFGSNRTIWDAFQRIKLQDKRSSLSRGSSQAGFNFGLQLG